MAKVIRSGTTSKWLMPNHLPVRPEPGHHLVGDHDDAVAVAELPDSGQVAGRGTMMPAVPGTDSRMIAAIVAAPSWRSDVRGIPVLARTPLFVPEKDERYRKGR